MSISNLRDPQGHNLAGITMRYEEGGKIQVYSWNGKEVRLGATATDEEVAAAFKEAE